MLFDVHDSSKLRGFILLFYYMMADVIVPAVFFFHSQCFLRRWFRWHGCGDIWKLRKIYKFHFLSQCQGRVFYTNCSCVQSGSYCRHCLILLCENPKCRKKFLKPWKIYCIHLAKPASGFSSDGLYLKLLNYYK